MSPRYTILSFNFGGYDKLREPKAVDPDAEYVFVTDRPASSSRWKVVVDPKLVNRNPIYSSYYVRYHPFEYASTGLVVTLDASVQLNDSLAPIVEEFRTHDYAVMLTNYRTDEDKLHQWTVRRPRMSDDDGGRISAFMRKAGQAGWKGSVGRAFIAQRDTPAVNRFNRHVWRYLLALGRYGIPNRQDEIVVHKLLDRYRGRLDLFPVSVQIVQSTYMTYCVHGSDTPVPAYRNYDQYYYLCDRPVTPARFDRKVSFPRTYSCGTTAMLLTRYLSPDDLREWLDHHLYTVKFDRVHVFDNSELPLKDVCDGYGPRVSYERVHGHPRQYRLYDSYVNVHSDARWVMPVDDDEFLWLDGFSSVAEAIRHYKEKFPHMMILGVRWKHMFPGKFHTERTGKVLDYCTVPSPELARQFDPLGDRGIKCIVERYGEVHYEETWENPAGGHVPKHTCFYGAAMCDGSACLGCGIPAERELDDERIRLLHCRYRGYSDWKRKSGECMTVCDSSPRPKASRFDALLPSLP